MTTETATEAKQYILNRETGKIELHFSKVDYQALTEAQKSDLKRSFLFSGKLSAWVSRSVNNHYSAINTAQKLGFVDGGKIGERLTFAEELERKTEKAEARAERFEQYADNAENRAEKLQSEFNENRKDWSWLTQPNINSSAGRSFTNQKNKIMACYEKGFEEYRKSEYFRDRAITAAGTASKEQLKSKRYLNNRIEECNKNIRELERNMVQAEEMQREKRIEELLERMEYEIDKLAFLENCMDDLGGVQYNKDNVKNGYLIKVRGSWATVIKANSKTVYGDYVEQHLKGCYCQYPYAEIQEMKIPEGWTETKKEVIVNPFNVGDILIDTNISGNRIIIARQVVKVTPKQVIIQRIHIDEDNNIPMFDKFTDNEQERYAYKKDRNGNFVVDYRSWRLRKYINPEAA